METVWFTIALGACLTFWVALICVNTAHREQEKTKLNTALRVFLYLVLLGYPAVTILFKPLRPFALWNIALTFGVVDSKENSNGIFYIAGLMAIVLTTLFIFWYVLVWQSRRHHDEHPEHTETNAIENDKAKQDEDSCAETA